MWKNRLLKYVAIIAMTAVVNLTIGCNTDTDRPLSNSDVQSVETKAALSQIPYTIQLPACTVNLYGTTLDKSSRLLDIEYTVEVPGADLDWRVLQIRELEGSEESCIYEVTDSSGTVLFGMAIEPDAVDTNTFVLTEWTPFDRLSIRRTLAGERMYERYTFNGEVFDANFTESELDAAFNTLRSRPEVTSQSFSPAPDANNDPRHLVSFINFYDGTSTLDNNEDGLIMAYLISDAEFQTWLESQLGISLGEGSKKLTIDRLCQIASSSTVKCMLGGILNPLCHVAVGTSVACAGYYIYGAITDEW